MIRRVKLAKINLTMQTGTIVRWLKKEGERVERDEPLLEVETDKAVNTVESFYSGYLKKILVTEGQEVPVDTLIAYIGEPGDEVPAAPPKSLRSRASARVSGAQRRARRLRADPQRRAAAGAGGEGAGLSTRRRWRGAWPPSWAWTWPGSPAAGPTGASARRTCWPPRSAGPAAGRGPGRIGRGPHAAPRRKGVSCRSSRLKKLTGERMKASYLQAPHIYLDVVGATSPRLEALRARLNAGGPRERGTLHPDGPAGPGGQPGAGGKPASQRDVPGGPDPGLRRAGHRPGRAAGPGGLVVPVIRGCQRLSLRQIRDRRRELVARAREGRQTLEDLQGGTFTITNLGMYGVDAFRPILYPGQAAILAVGAVRRLALADEAGKISAQPVLQLTLGCDHRVVDGAEGAVFLSRLKELLEQPACRRDQCWQ